MDPVAHALFGRALAATVPGRAPGRGVTAALVLGSLAPDVDAVLAFRGFDTYLWAHASGSHSLLGAALVGVMVAGVLRLLVRDSRLAPLTVAAAVGALGHVFWDLADGSDMSVLWPFSDTVFGWHLVSMGDPIVVGILAAALAVGWTRPRWGRRAAVTATTALAALLLFKAASQQRAIALFRATAGDAPSDRMSIAPQLGRLFVWTIYDRSADRVRGWRVDARARRVTMLFEYQDQRASAVARIAEHLPVVRAVLGPASIPFARLETDGPMLLVLWSDVRTCSARACDLSFGGAFDAHQMPLYQVIRIGAYVQKRRLPVDR